MRVTSVMPWSAVVSTSAGHVARVHDPRFYDAASPFAREKHCTLRQAAFAIGIQRVAEAEHVRGYI